MLQRILILSSVAGAMLALLNLANAEESKAKPGPAAQQRPVQQDVIIADYQTHYQTKREANNIEIAATSVNGVVIEPNKTMSLNDVLGERTLDRGYVLAPVQVRILAADNFGGGVHQLASTLHAAALLAGLEIAEWHPAQSVQDYIEPGFDAVITDKGFDLRVTNRFTFPVTVFAHASRGRLIVGFTGRDDPYNVQLTIIEERNPETPTKYIFREDWKRGREHVVSKGAPAYEFILQRTVTNQTGSYRVVEPRHIKYAPVERVIEVGTGGKMSERCTPVRGARYADDSKKTTSRRVPV